MKKIVISTFSVMLFLLAGSLMWNSCKKDDSVQPKDFDTTVRSLPYPFPTDYMDSQDLSSALQVGESIVDTSGGQICTTAEYEYAPGFSEAILLDPTSDVIAPGMLVEPNGLSSGNYTPITEAKAPITISHSLGNSKTVENPSLSTIRAAIQELNQDVSVNPANFTYEYEMIYSAEQLKLAIDGHYGNPWVQVNAGFDWNSSTTKSRLYAKFVQLYYTIDVDPIGKNNPSDWFEELPDPEIWNSTPVYVASVKYGRIGILSLESEASQEDLNAYFKATYDAFEQTAELEVASEYTEIHEKTNYKVFILGGNPNIAVDSIGSFWGFKNWITSSAEFTPESPGSPIAYSLKYLKNNELATIVLSGSFSITNCEDDVYQFELVSGPAERPLEGPYYPIKIGGGDGEFDGNGPMQNAVVELLKNPVTEDWSLHVKYHVKETKSNWTEGDYDENVPLYDYLPDSIQTFIDNGWKIDKVLSVSRSEIEDREFDGTSYDIVTNSPSPASSLVYKFKFLGDTKGNDIWDEAFWEEHGDLINPNYSASYGGTNMMLEFNPIWVTFRESGG